jgi:cation diffusion facilitator family transporter
VSENQLARRALRASVFTVVYNVLEGVVSMVLGARAGSAALIGFGLDSFVEALSGSVMVWRFAEHDRLSEAEIERRETRAIKLIGWTFAVLGAYIVYESVAKLWKHEPPQASPGGMILAAISIVVMFFLARTKRRLGEQLHSHSLIADSLETLVCIWLSVSLLVGLGLNWALHWWWADPVVGLVIAVFLFREGHELITEGGCTCGHEEKDADGAKETGAGE